MHPNTKKRISFLVQIIIAALFIAFFAQIAIKDPINKDGIPITGSTFAVLLVGFFLGTKKGVLAVLFYLTLGAIGLPVFAEKGGGMDVLFGVRVGFLTGFLFGVAITGYLGENGWGNSFFKCLLGMIIGTMIISASGVLFLAIKFDLAIALEKGFYPYLWGALIKVLIGATIPPIYHNLIKEK